VTNAITKQVRSSSRAYAGAQLGMTPARLPKRQRRKIDWAAALSPFGWVIVAHGPRRAGCSGRLRSERASCAKNSAAELRRDPALRAGGCGGGDCQQQHERCPKARCTAGSVGFARTASSFALAGAAPIPRGERALSQLAEMGQPRQLARWLGCALNGFLSWFLPSVVGASGSLTGYRWESNVSVNCSKQNELDYRMIELR